jgi:signal transduction histidine kinase
MRTDDLIITIAYFSIPVQLLVSLFHYPRLAAMPLKIVLLLVLFALFIFLCGAGHLMRSIGMTDVYFNILNGLTAAISLTTALYLLPLVPNMMSTIDKSLQDLKHQEELAESKRKLVTFMAFLCHELRNPLFAITSNLEFALDEEMSAEQERALSVIKESTNLMLRLVNDVLDLSKLESGKLELEERDFDIREMMLNIASITDTQIQLKHGGAVQFKFKMSPDVPQIVRGDSVRILQIGETQ